MDELNWIAFPKNIPPTDDFKDIVQVFQKVLPNISSAKHVLKSNDVLKHATEGLEKLGFKVEKGKKRRI